MLKADFVNLKTKQRIRNVPVPCDFETVQSLFREQFGDFPKHEREVVSLFLKTPFGEYDITEPCDFSAFIGDVGRFESFLSTYGWRKTMALLEKDSMDLVMSGTAASFFEFFNSLEEAYAFLEEKGFKNMDAFKRSAYFGNDGFYIAKNGVVVLDKQLMNAMAKFYN